MRTLQEEHISELVGLAHIYNSSTVFCFKNGNTSIFLDCYFNIACNPIIFKIVPKFKSVI